MRIMAAREGQRTTAGLARLFRSPAELATLIHPSIAVVINDLIFLTKIQTTARSLGLLTHHLASVDDLGVVLAELHPGAVIIDLNTARGDVGGAITMLAAMADRPRVVGFFSHVDEHLARAATEAGADEVMPRSRFSHELPQLLARYAPTAAAAATPRPGGPAH
jgi:DNA-binding NarL/FixJ family response regulator